MIKEINNCYKQRLEEVLKEAYSPENIYFQIMLSKRISEYKNRNTKNVSKSFKSKVNSPTAAVDKCIVDYLYLKNICGKSGLEYHYDKLMTNNMPRLLKIACSNFRKIGDRFESLEDLEKYLEQNKQENYKSLIENSIIYLYMSQIMPNKIKTQINELIPEKPWDAYPEARKIKRHFYLHVGGTNTGKTYQSLERLKNVSSGAYLGPLRLLAMEVFEKLNTDNVPCNLLTGEQEEEVPFANHVASTIEMANYSKHYDVVVIDECQMISDPERGGNWTEAIMGMLSEEIHLCMAPIAKDVCIKIIENCGDTYEVIEHERFVPLKRGEHVDYDKIVNNLKEGDALILFSRKKVLEMASFLEDKGKSVSVIYGALPYETRKAQIERFINKETKYVVSTDAIGMGLNLPIHRVVFVETEKFDGKQKRELLPEEIKQIAGRAGRRGMYEEGFYSSVSSDSYIHRAITRPSPSISKVYLKFPESLLDIDEKISNVISVWSRMELDDFYEKTEIERTCTLLQIVEGYSGLTKKEIYNLCTIPFDEDNKEQFYQWMGYVKNYAKDKDFDMYKPKLKENTLFGYENYYKQLGLYFGFCKKMGKDYDAEWLNKELSRVSKKIDELLIKSIKDVKKCIVCGKPVDNRRYDMCKKCYRKSLLGYDDWNDFF